MEVLSSTPLNRPNLNRQPDSILQARQAGYSCFDERLVEQARNIIRLVLNNQSLNLAAQGANHIGHNRLMDSFNQNGQRVGPFSWYEDNPGNKCAFINALGGRSDNGTVDVDIQFLAKADLQFDDSRIRNQWIGFKLIIQSDPDVPDRLKLTVRMGAEIWKVALGVLLAIFSQRDGTPRLGVGRFTSLNFEVAKRPLPRLGDTSDMWRKNNTMHEVIRVLHDVKNIFTHTTVHVIGRTEMRNELKWVSRMLGIDFYPDLPSYGCVWWTWRPRRLRWATFLTDMWIYILEN